GVVAVASAADIGAAPLAPRMVGDGFTPTAWPALAAEPRFCGEAVAVVVATTAYAAADGAARVTVDYDVRPARLGIDAALADRRAGATPAAPGEVDRVTTREPGVGRPRARAARARGGRRRRRRSPAGAAGAPPVRRRRLPRLSTDRGARAAGQRGDPAGPLPH